VGVWARPLFTTLYALPALAGYTAAKLFTVLICLALAWETWRLAEDLQLNRSPLVIPFLFLQPSFFIICADTMTEPIFALVFVAALRLHLRGRVTSGLILASFMILARPEGFFLGLWWALWMLFDRRFQPAWYRRLPRTLLLATGSILWWLGAWLITGDPLFIKHNWPTNWPVTGTIYGEGAWWSYLARLPEIAGFLLFPVFTLGLIALLRRRRLFELTSTFILFFLLHTILRTYGLLGSAGYPRYFVAISPAIAIITLEGWNRLADHFHSISRIARGFIKWTVLAASLLLCFAYFDGAEWVRDARAVRDMREWFRHNPAPLDRLIWSQAYMCIAFDQDPWENLIFAHDRGRDLSALRASPIGTLVFWEERFGPKWHALTPEDFEAAGYRLLHSQPFLLEGYLLPRSFFGYGGPRRQRYYFFYREK
jgi:uncharacterized membrane protein